VIHDFIDHELDYTLSSFSPDIKSQLADAAKRYLSGQLSLQAAQDFFLRSSASISILTKLQQILSMGDVPLPPRVDPTPTGQRRRSFPWTDPEDLRLLVAVSRFGARDWRLIASFVGSGRTSSQCNQRWCRALDPAISRKAWTESDDQQLLRAVEVLGKASWCQVAKILTGRTDVQCRYRYFQLAKVSEVAETPGPELPEPPPEPGGSVDQVAKHRRNSISIAWFTGEMDLERLKAGPPSPMLPYYLESSLTPRDDPDQQYLHRVPPLLFPRTSKI
jgi:hypothetical protein